MRKILNLEKLSSIIDKKRRKKEKIVLSHGVFDILHIGHIKHFQAAKKLGDVLIVSLTKDQFIDKGPNRPFFNLKLRMEAIASLSEVDFVTFSNIDSGVDVIKKIKPNIYCKGQDYKILKKDVSKKIYEEKKILEKFKGKIFFTNEMKFSSSKILNKFNLSLNDQQKKFIEKILPKIKKSKFINFFQLIQKQKILILGEMIIDKYSFCKPLGKSGKDPIMMFSKVKEETYVGGAGAIANHAKEISNNVSMYSMIGDENNYVNFLNKNLSKKIKKHFYIKKDSPTIEKQKFLDFVTHNKIIGFYKFNDQQIKEKDEIKMYNKIKKILTKDTVLLISDYGHGMISSKLAKKLLKLKNFVTLNAQVNAANSGTHSIKKYSNIDLVIINETELKNELRNNYETTENLMIQMSKMYNFKIIVVTKGKDGVLLYNNLKSKFYFCPAFTDNVVDKIGSGDAMLAVMSLVYKITKDEEISLFLGSLAASQQVQIMGNKKSISGMKLIKTFNHLVS